MKELHPGTSKIGFLVKNYVYSLIPRSVALHHEDLRSTVNTREKFRFNIKNSDSKTQVYCLNFGPWMV